MVKGKYLQPVMRVCLNQHHLRSCLLLSGLLYLRQIIHLLIMPRMVPTNRLEHFLK